MPKFTRSDGTYVVAGAIVMALFVLAGYGLALMAPTTFACAMQTFDRMTGITPNE